MKKKLLQIKSKLSDNKKRAVAWLLVGSLVLGLAPIPKTTVQAVEPTNPIPEEGGYFTETNTGDMNRVPYNNDDLLVDLSASVFGTVLVADNNGDNVLDIIISTTCEGIPVASHVFYGKAGAQDEDSNEYMVMEKAVAATGNKSTAEQAYGTCVYNTISGENSGYKNSYAGTIVTQSAWTHGTGASWPWANTVNYTLPGLSKDSTAEEIEVYQKQLKYADNTSVTLLKPGTNPDGSSYSFADYDGDGDLDLIYSINSWVDFGWSYGTPAEYDNNGIWDTDGDGKEDRIHGFVYWFQNTREYAEGTALWDTRGNTTTPPIYGEPQVIMVYDEEGNVNPLDTYSHPEAKMYDFDNDGDLDIVCGSWSDEITYYENVQVDQSLDMPKFKEGRPFVNENLSSISAEHMLLSIEAVDWNNDGWMDLVVSEEDTRVFLLENTGTTDGNNTPVMKAPQYFQQEADSVKVGVFATPYSIDWDGDGDEDLVYGNSGGFIEYVENLSIVEENGEYVKKRDLSDPSWAKPVRFEDTTGEVYHITGRMEGIDGQYAGYYGSIQGPVEQKVGLTKISVGYWDEDDILDIMSNNIRGEIYLHKGTEKGSTVLAEAELVKVEWEDDDKDGIPDPKLPDWYNKEYDQRKYYAEQGYLITQWRTTPFMIDLPVTDTDGDGVAEGDGLTDLVMLDHEGYLAFFERYRDTETNELKLKEGKRIFKDTDGSVLGLRADTAYETYNDGKSGRRLFTMVDYDLDGDLDLIVDDQVNRWNIEYRENISTAPGEYKFAAPYSMHTRNYAYHTPCPTVCDWNQDGIPDVLVGTEAGYLYYLKNTVVKSPEESLVAHWDFEGKTEAAMLEDKATAGGATNNLSIGNASNVTIENGIATITGNGYLTTPNEADLNQTGKMTLFARVYVDGGPGATTDYISKCNGNVYAYSLGSYYDGSPYMLTCNIDNGGFTASGKMPRGAWRELAVVVDGSDGSWTMKVYMSKDQRTGTGSDFELLGTKTFTTHRVNDAALIIGNTLDKIDSPATRKFDDVRIYNSALTVEQLAALLPAVNLDENLVAHWDFEGDTEDEALLDKSTGGKVSNNLTIENFDKTGGVVINGGVATVTGGGYLMSPDEADLDRNGEITIYVRALVDGWADGKASTSLINKASDTAGYNYSIQVPDGGYDNYGLAIATTKSDWSTGAPDYRNWNIFPRNEWREVAYVISKEGNNYYYQIYISNGERTGSADDFTVLKEKTLMGTVEPMVNSCELLIGMENNKRASSSTRKFDDVRIYNKALTTEQLATLLPAVVLEENLVAHWDFEGDADTTALEDKATAGTADNLDIGGTTGNITIEDGIATLKGDGAFMADNSTDLAPSSKMTIFMKAYIEGSGEVCLINKAGSNYNSRMAYKLDVWENGRLNFCLCKADWENPQYGKDAVGPERDTWREIAIVLDKNQDGYVTAKAYVSKDIQTSTGADFKLLWEHTFDITEPLNTSLGLTIGNGYVAGNQTLTLTDSDVTRRFDDVRIYNTALTTEQLAGLITVETVEEEEYNLDNGAYDLSTVGTNVWVNGEIATETSLNKSGEYEIAVGTESNLVKRVLLYRPGNANIPVDESTDVIDVRDLVAIIKASDGIELSSKAATKGADADVDGVVDREDVTASRDQLLEQ